MRARTRIGVVAAMVAMLGLVAGSVAQSSQIYEQPDYTSMRLFFHHHIPNHYEVEEGEPFLFGGGIDPEVGFNPNDIQILLFQDGVQLEPEFVGCTIPAGGDPSVFDPNQRCGAHTYAFHDGLPAGEYQFYIAYSAPCGAWESLGFGRQFVVTSCVDPMYVMTHPELSGIKTVTVTPAP